MKSVSLKKATDRQLQTVARSEGLDEDGWLDEIEARKLSKSTRASLIRALRFGRRIDRIDVTNPNFVAAVRAGDR